jgi:ribonuclease BN (tRNA processing enzyme)
MNLQLVIPKPAVAGEAPQLRSESDDERFEVRDFSSTQKFFEIVGPQHLATFLRTSLICSDAHFSWNYHVTELLPAGSPIPHIDKLHDNEAPPTFILPDSDGIYSVLAGHPSGVAVRAVTLTHRVFCIGYALTEPQRPGK